MDFIEPVLITPVHASLSYDVMPLTAQGVEIKKKFVRNQNHIFTIFLMVY